MTRWAILTGEYPPQPGGVADYTRLVASALARAGDEVHVWVPRVAPHWSSDGVEIHALPDRFGRRSCAALDAQLGQLEGKYRLLVQYVPTAFGWHGMNVPFCLWLRRRRDAAIDVVFHEVAFPWGPGESLACNVRGAVTRVMARLLTRAATRLFVSTPAWERLLRRPGEDRAIAWLPVPSTVTSLPAPVAVARAKAVLGCGDRPVIGHFGTYGPPARAALADLAPPLLDKDPRRVLLLLGRGGPDYARDLLADHTRLEGRIVAPGFMPADELGAYLAASAMLLQPYPDGVSSRRTTAMAALYAGIPLVTTDGPLTEPLWRDSGAAMLVPLRASHAEWLSAVDAVLDDRGVAARLVSRGRDLYTSHFALERIIALLREPGAPVAACA
jgi:glycosyltransferase involved in cell wall biosynthesis